MFVCICRGITDQKITDLVKQGMICAIEIRKNCGAGSDCGSCKIKVDRLVKNILEQPSQEEKKTA